jgi:hypothetical protein
MAYVNTSRIARKGFADRLVVAKDAVLAAINQRRVYARTVAELNSLTDRELTDLGDRQAADAKIGGISRLAIPEIAREAAYGK